MTLPDLYEVRTAIATICADAELRGHYTSADLARLEDLGEQLSQIVEQELRDRSTATYARG